jgi:hypothetical protein
VATNGLKTLRIIMRHLFLLLIFGIPWKCHDPLLAIIVPQIPTICEYVPNTTCTLGDNLAILRTYWIVRDDMVCQNINYTPPCPCGSYVNLEGQSGLDWDTYILQCFWAKSLRS